MTITLKNASKVRTGICRPVAYHFLAIIYSADLIEAYSVFAGGDRRLALLVRDELQRIA